ncbi:uncharacterized protein RBU57_010943 [Macrochelys suwanniensis]
MESQNQRRAPAWTEREVRDLIAVWGDETVLAELRSKRRNANTYAKVSKGMQDRGYNRDAQQCRVKIKELRQAYQRTRDANGHSGSEPQTCCFYDELHAILGSAASIDPPMWYDSVCGSSETTEEHFRGEEDDDNDAQNSAQTQKGSGEALFPDSQELFVTLEPVPSEPTQGVLDDGEGTSAANVSTPPLSSPSQRLAKIRSKKKRNRDDMFTELMQSSHTETAQQNAWRQTLMESRTAEFDRADRWCAEDNDWRDEVSRWRQRAERRQDAILRLLEDQTEILRLMAEERHGGDRLFVPPSRWRRGESPSIATASKMAARKGPHLAVLRRGVQLVRRIAIATYPQGAQ